jgi:hypothetical protein
MAGVKVSVTAVMVTELMSFPHFVEKFALTIWKLLLTYSAKTYNTLTFSLSSLAVPNKYQKIISG